MGDEDVRTLVCCSDGIGGIEALGAAEEEEVEALGAAEEEAGDGLSAAEEEEGDGPKVLAANALAACRWHIRLM